MERARKDQTVAHSGGGCRTRPLRQMCLDDFLAVIDQTTRWFALDAPKCVKQIGSYPGAKAAMESLVRDTMALHDGEVYTRPHLQLEALGKSIYGEPVTNPAYSGHRISSPCLGRVLQHVFDLGLQTIVRLPSRDPKPSHTTKQLKALASALSRDAERVSTAFGDNWVRERIRLLSQVPGADPPSHWKVVSEMRKAAEFLSAVANLKVIKVPLGSPNPQVRHAMYFENFLVTCTGRPQYARLQTLLQAAFYAAKKEVPRWVDRLAIEMNLQRKHRQRFSRALRS